MSKQIKYFTFFFEDFRSGDRAPKKFISEVVCNLDMTIYKPFDVVIGMGQKVNDLCLIQSGKCNLYGLIKTTDEREHWAHIVSFKKKSWYGDF